MIKQFPEIIDFFEQDSFSQEALDSLRENIVQTYDKKISEIAQSLIDLQLAKYKLEGTKKTNRKNAKSPKLKQNEILPSVAAFKGAETKHNLITSRTINKLKTKNIIEIAEELQLSLVRLNRCFLHFNVIKKSDEYLTSKELKLVSPFLKSRSEALDRLSKQKSRTKKKKKLKFTSSNKSSGVYGIIRKYGGVGKLIYTRM